LSPRTSSPSPNLRTYLRRRGGVLAEPQHDPLLPQGRRHRLADRLGLARKQSRLALAQRHLAAEAPERLRQLDADRPAAEHDQGRRQLLELGRLAVRPDAVELAQTVDRRNDGRGPGGHDDLVARVLL
jgi:hypothetical protein